MSETAHAPLLQQVEIILEHMGFEPTFPGARLYMKNCPAGQKLCVEFYRVTDRTVQKTGYPIQPAVSHMEFVGQHTRYLFGG